MAGKLLIIPWNLGKRSLELGRCSASMQNVQHVRMVIQERQVAQVRIMERFFGLA